ncbi:MFS transporter [Winogradskyella litoriviva]|uniref:MFS transporter n=1 Tax=Winogradskyella litoriviva TaxID=1220182 RepID=A0ABX2E3D9_9FLAO|nr:MFS transporter [Winogradskyella litoriviva]NRD22553.1 MFS transporter [Winogradskyella litoriviva]
MNQFKKGSKKLLNAWAFYDWANSVYTLTIASSIFPLFYSSLFDSKEELVAAFGFEMKQETLITIVTAFTFLIVAIMSPILSGIADYVGNKKNFMKFFCYVGSVGCIGLFWFDRNYIHLSLMFYFMGLIGYWGSLVFYNSYLPDIAFEEQQDSISAKGFSMGYIGSVLLLIVNLVMVMSQEDNADKIEMMRYSFITVGIWWALFSQYTFYILPAGVSSGHKVTKDVVFNGFRELKSVWSQLKLNLRLKRYLNAFFVFSMAVQTIMLMAVYFGEKEINWGTDSEKTIGLIVSILVIQLVAVLGAILTSRAASKFGSVKTLIAINFLWMCLCIYAYFMNTPLEFYIAAGFVGLVMGGVQSLGRSTYSKFLPETEDTTSYFSFYDVAEKIGIVIGMLIFAIVSENYSMRYAILFLVVFFFIGIILLFRVPKENKEV